MRRLLTFAERFRMDNPLTQCGSDVYQPNEPINLCYDTFGPAAAFMRGLFEYLYRSDGLTLLPHVPASITELEQLDPIRFGGKKLFLATFGRGPITAVRVNGRKWKQFDAASVFLPYDKTPETAQIQIMLGNATPPARRATKKTTPRPPVALANEPLAQRTEHLREFQRRLTAAGLGGTYEAAHTALALDFIETTRLRQSQLQSGKIKSLPGPAQAAADQLYADTALKLGNGLEALLKSCETAAAPTPREMYRLWREASH
jgi:hypothetical protein